MDIAGAKALKKRLGSKGADDAPPTSVDVPEDAPPVYHWTGVRKPRAECPADDVDGDEVARAATLFRRVGLSLR